MKVENISNKIIGVGAVSILPGETKEVDTIFAANPALAIYENIGFIRILERPTAEAVEEAVEDKEEAEELAAEELRLKRLASLKGISEEALAKLANELGINPAIAKDKADLTKKVRAFLKKN